MLLGLSMSLPFCPPPMRGGGGDPIAAMFNLLRLQTYSLDQVDFTRQCTVIAGAGSAIANTRYYRLDDYTWQTDDGSKKITFDEFDQQWIIRVNDNRYYISGTGYDYTLGPADVDDWMEDEVGTAPMPTSSYIDEVNYTPLGIPATAPTAVETWTGSVGQATQSNALARPLTGRDNGVPVLVFDGADDYLEGVFSAPHTRKDYTVLVACKRENPDNAWQAPWFGGAANGDSFSAGGVPILGRRNQTNEWGCHNPWINDTGPFINQGSDWNTWQVSVLRRSNTDPLTGEGNLKLWAMGAVTGHVQDWPAIETAQWTIGGQSFTAGYPLGFGGKIIAICHADRALSDAEVATAITYFEAHLPPP